MANSDAKQTGKNTITEKTTNLTAWKNILAECKQVLENFVWAKKCPVTVSLLFLGRVS